ncbi:MAG: hypothetical protein ACTHOO_01280 [Alcanivorax sp.]
MKYLFIALSFIFLVPTTANASFSPYIAGKKLVRTSEAIFIGKATKIEQIPKILISSKYYNIAARFEVVQSFKGTDDKKVINVHYYHPSISDIHPPKENNTYIVFAEKDNENNKLYASGCRKDKINLSIKKAAPNTTTLDTLEALSDKYPEFKDDVINQWIIERKKSRNFFERIVYFLL